MNSKKLYRYLLVDVFTDRPLEGNALAVFPDASGMDDTSMQKIARELNLSETTFVFPSAKSDCEAYVRIFTPLKEMIFAGHPTIGTAYVLMKEGLISGNKESFQFEEKVGPVPVIVENCDPPLIWLRTPAIIEDVTFEISVCAEVLGLGPQDMLDITPQLLSAGNPTVFIALKDKDAVDRARLDSSGSAVFNEKYPDPLCVFVFCPTPEGAYSRMFAPQYGLSEDPATGSSTGPLAAFMMKNELLSGSSGTRFISEQGVKMGRRSILHVYIDGNKGHDGIFVGGNVTPVAEAVMSL